MTEKTSFLQEVAEALRDNGIAAAITALIGGTIALLASVTRKAFTNDAMLARLDRELSLERDRIDRQRAEDRDGDADRLTIPLTNPIHPDPPARRVFYARRRAKGAYPCPPIPVNPSA